MAGNIGDDGVSEDECYCDECNSLRCDYPWWARTWKRAAKKWHTEWKFEQQEGITDNKLRLIAEATATRRLELLRRALLQLEIHAPRQAPLMDEIAKELADATVLYFK